MPAFCDVDATYKLADNLLTVLTKGASERLGNVNFGRAYVAVSEPVADQCCEGGQVTVHVSSIRPTQQDFANGEVCLTGFQVDLTVTAFQCYPIGVEEDNLTPIKPEALDKASQWVYKVGHALYYTAFKAMTDGSIYPETEDGFTAVLMRKSSSLGDMIPMAQQETCTGWRFNVTLEYEIDI